MEDPKRRGRMAYHRAASRPKAVSHLRRNVVHPNAVISYCRCLGLRVSYAEKYLSLSIGLGVASRDHAFLSIPQIDPALASHVRPSHVVTPMAIVTVKPNPATKGSNSLCAHICVLSTLVERWR
jgi:hypothetical protein